MPRYKPVDYHQTTLIPVAFSAQIFPDSFEYTLNDIVDHELDLSIFDSHYRNDGRGAPAWHPGVLLKIILYAYARGMTSSREIERACRENITFMALSGNSRPHFTTIADFISTMEDQIMPLFLEVLLVCDDMGLIGKDMFAIPQGDFLWGVDWLQTAGQCVKRVERHQGGIGGQGMQDGAGDSLHAGQTPAC